MNFAIFSPLGYASVALWAAMPLLWLLQWLIRPRKWFCHLALIAGIAALVLANINSRSYVNAIQKDRSEEIAAQKKKEEEARLRKEQERAEDVADVEFIEDDRGDMMDRGGMDDEDRAYYDDTPAWKRQKRTRDQNAQDTSLEGQLETGKEKTGVDVATTGEGETKAPVVLLEKDYDMAHRLDRVNLKIVRIFLVLALVILIIDYFSRFNRYRDAYMPLPFPSQWVNTIGEVPAIQKPSPKPRRSLEDELRVITKRGDSFLYLCDSPDDAKDVPNMMSALPFGLCKKEILPADFDGEELSYDFVFDALWFGRCSFTVDSKEYADNLLARVVELLAERKDNRGRASQTVHIIWTLKDPVPEILERNISILGPSTGFSLFCYRNTT